MSELFRERARADVLLMEAQTLRAKVNELQAENARLKQAAETIAEIDHASGLDELSTNALQLTEINSKAFQLRQAARGHPYAKIAWPHRLLHDSAKYIETMETENAKLKAELARAREALIDEWAWNESICCEEQGHSIGVDDAKDLAKERYKREIAQEGVCTPSNN